MSKEAVAVKPKSGRAWPADKVERWPLARLVPNAHNVRRHSERQIRQIARAIDHWGWTVPVLVDEAGGIIAGHGRVLAAQKLGIDSVPVMVASGWSAEQKRAYLIADNKLTENGEWDKGLLAIELGSLRDEDFDVELTGFGGDELDAALARAVKSSDFSDPEAAPARPDVAVTRRGDLWLLGKHRLLCGDATDQEAVLALFGGAKPNLMVTDPPYGVDYDPAWRHEAAAKGLIGFSAKRMGTVANDHRVDWTEAWKLFPGDVVYCWHADRYASEVQATLERVGFIIRSQIIWAKDSFSISRGDYHWQHEPCWYAVRKDASSHWNGDRSQSTLWRINKADGMDTGTHGTQKPIACMLRPIVNSSAVGDAVYDPFVGSGTTLIAATTTDRRGLAMELDEAYCDVAVRRWQDFTQDTAKLQGDGRSFADIAKSRAAEKQKTG